MKRVLLLVLEGGKVRRYEGEILRHPADFHAFRFKDRLICVTCVRTVSYQRINEYDAFLGAYSYLREQGARADEIWAARDVSRRDIVKLFQSFSAS